METYEVIEAYSTPEEFAQYVVDKLKEKYNPKLSEDQRELELFVTPVDEHYLDGGRHERILCRFRLFEINTGSGRPEEFTARGRLFIPGRGKQEDAGWARIETKENRVRIRVTDS